MGRSPAGSTRLRSQRGQTVVFAVGALVSLMGFAALVIDVGYAYYAQRALQASADAAALAGAQQLPNPAASVAVAREYGTQPTAKNRRENLGEVDETISTRCLTRVPGCSPVNAIVVRETARVNTMFARVLGLDAFTIRAKATACSPCGVRPLDVMLVLDRTLSMCMTHSGGWDGSCTDLENAREGTRTFLNYMDPERGQWVGLAALPPARNLGTKCNSPSNSNYNFATSRYVLVPLSSDYAVDDELNPASDLVSTINCVRAGGETAYANAIDAAQAELDTHGRPDVQDVIVFFSDGAANTGPTYYPMSSPYRKQPCHQGVWSAGTAKGRGTLVYSIGYDLNALDGGANECKAYSFFGPDEAPPITAYQALHQIASNGGTFFNQPTAGELSGIYEQIAEDISRGSAALIDESIQ